MAEADLVEKCLEDLLLGVVLLHLPRRGLLVKRSRRAPGSERNASFSCTHPVGQRYWSNRSRLHRPPLSGDSSIMASVVNVAVSQFRPKKGDYAVNLSRVGELFARLGSIDPRPNVLVLPETALTGYFLEGGVRDHAVSAGTLARDLAATYVEHVSGAEPTDIVIGFYEVWRHTLYNSAMYVTLSRGAPVIHHVHRKIFLPTYGLFDEERFVERGREIRAFDTAWGRAAMLVCEDAWHSMSGTIAALDGAQVIIVPTAPPARGAWPKSDGVPGPASVSRWERLARDMADEPGL